MKVKTNWRKWQNWYLQSLLLRILGLRAQKRTIESICIHLGIWHQLAWTKAKLEALYDCMGKYTQHLVSLIRNINDIETFFTSSHFDKLESFFSVKSLFRERSTKNHILKNVTFHGQQHHHEDEPPVRRCDLVAP